MSESSNSFLHSFLDLFLQFPVVPDCPAGSSQSDNGSHMDESVKGCQRGRALPGKLKNFFPELNCFERKEADLLDFVL